MDERSQHYLSDYWREAPRRAWRDALRFAGSHVVFGVVLVVVDFISEIALGDASYSSAKHVLFATLRDLLAAAILTYLWHLVIVTPARIRRDAALVRIADLGTERASCASDLANVPDLKATIEESAQHRDAKTILLDIANSGGPAERIYAEIIFVAGPFQWNSPDTHFLQGGDGKPMPKSCKLPVATASRAGGGDQLRWDFPCKNYGRSDNTNRVDLSTTGWAATIRLEVSSVPESKGGPISLEITLTGWDYRVKQITPSPAPPSTDPPSPKASA